MGNKSAALSIIKLANLPIFQQLQYEEALLRNDQRNWCLINRGTPPAIVLGISSKTELLLNEKRIKEAPVTIIRRFTGGGTVVVDENTLFVTFIFNSDSINIPPFPQQVLHWSEQFYRPVFSHSSFCLKENDFVFGNQKFGGNAQYMQKNRWLLHTSFLWDYSMERMEYLQLPPKRPKYRSERPHHEFLCKLRDHFEQIHEIENQLLSILDQNFQLKEVDMKEIDELLNIPHRKASHIIN